MQAVAGGHIDLHAEGILKNQFDAHEIDQREFFVRIIIHEQVEVALGGCFIPNGRAEQVKGYCPAS